MCRDCSVDSIHALWYCDALKAIWMSDVCFSFLRTQKLSTFEDLVQFLFLHGSADLCAHFVMVAWSVWELRNRVRLKQETWRVEEVCSVLQSFCVNSGICRRRILELLSTMRIFSGSRPILVFIRSTLMVPYLLIRVVRVLE